MTSVLPVAGYLGGLQEDAAASPLPDGRWLVGSAIGDGIAYTVTPGTLDPAWFLTADFLLDGVELAVFRLAFHTRPRGSATEKDRGPQEVERAQTGEARSERTWIVSFGLLNQCSARLRLPLSASDQSRWYLGREGGLLKPLSWGDPIDLADVDRIELTVYRKGPCPVRWCMTPLTVSHVEPARLARPLLPDGPLLDELGQSRQRTWATKARSVVEVSRSLRQQAASAADATWPEGFSRWGGWEARDLGGSGFFRTTHDGRRWWLVDPDGHPFWSSGPNCVQPIVDSACRTLESALEWVPRPDGPYADAIWPDEDVGEGSGSDAEGGRRASQSSRRRRRMVVNYLAANLIRAFGPAHWKDTWAVLARSVLRRAGFNTVANWSDWEMARDAGFPYVRPLHPEFRRTPCVYRDFPDVFHPEFVTEAAQFAEQLRVTAQDPAMVGYFLMNEPTWGFAAELPAAGMVRTATDSYTRRELVRWLTDKYGDDATLAAAWGCKVSLTALRDIPLTAQLTPAAEADLAEFSTSMVTTLFDTLSEACRTVDPHHLNLGARYYTVPPDWALPGMTSFDVFSINCYRERVPAAELAAVSDRLGRPVIIGEWHFGALDAGLPASGIGHVPDQHARGQAFRVYLEDAAAQPWCVGAHYFTLYDQSALGRFDGENYNIGFVDVCHRAYEPLMAAARASHSRLYQVASGHEAPFDERPEYLPRLFL
ncbi:MAG TPA: hypothetical protein VIL34_20645 [Actinopolymorphaceae bacterium]|jgi:hypothetical protein